MNFIKLFTLIVFSINLHAEENNIKALYEQHNINGSILIESLDEGINYQYNLDKKATYVPASTFKIPNTLIILEEGLLKSPHEVITWDGKVREYSAWNKNQTLKSAFQYSCVWCYQRYALKVGDEKYLSYLRKFDYGNLQTGSDITRFWLDGKLKISVKNQIKFLRKVYTEDLPIKKAHIKTLKNIMLSEENKDYTVWSKTGWSGKDGWYIGYLTTDSQTWFFANHIEILNESDLKLRKKLTIETFKALNIIH